MTERRYFMIIVTILVACIVASTVYHVVTGH